MSRNAQRELPKAAMIRAARALLGIDQAKLALLSGVTVKTISLIENAADGEDVDGRRRNIVERIRQRLEQEFDVEFVFPDGNGFGVLIKRPVRPRARTARRGRS
jgi:transcriptional regulator with XRE-family HTH domain